MEIYTTFTPLKDFGLALVLIFPIQYIKPPWQITDCCLHSGRCISLYLVNEFQL